MIGSFTLTEDTTAKGKRAKSMQWKYPERRTAKVQVGVPWSLRSALEAAARQNGHSLSEECYLRLARSVE